MTDTDGVELLLKPLAKEIDFESVDGGILTDKQEQTLRTAFKMATSAFHGRLILTMSQTD
ncbi:hypothetical protein [Halohasta litorea]|uniref:Uncharacterized protein n=1 Tax=Halohasta litorea TaxID=869891 RepID=A0ABD6DDC2_9EURY|nr:hypothetical protein [Halohasta litorea]